MPETCDVCSDRPAVAVVVGSRIAVWCEGCTGPELASRTYHYVMKVWPLTAFTADEYRRRDAPSELSCSGEPR